jgi:hypothetical protein
MDNNTLLMIILAFVVGYCLQSMLENMCGNRLVEGNVGSFFDSAEASTIDFLKSTGDDIHSVGNLAGATMQSVGQDIHDLTQGTVVQRGADTLVKKGIIPVYCQQGHDSAKDISECFGTAAGIGTVGGGEALAAGEGISSAFGLGADAAPELSPMATGIGEGGPAGFLDPFTGGWVSG